MVSGAEESEETDETDSERLRKDKLRQWRTYLDFWGGGKTGCIGTESSGQEVAQLEPDMHRANSQSA